MTTNTRISFFEQIVSLGTFAAQGYAWLVGPAVAVGGPLYLMWESVKIAASTHGWWVYPFVILASIFSIIGLWMFILHLNSRIRLMTPANIRIEEERKDVLKIADSALNIAAEINELIGEYQTRPPTIYDHEKDPNAWQRDNYMIQAAMLKKFMTKHAAKAQSILSMAKRYGVINERDVFWSFGSTSYYNIPEVRNLLIRTAMDLQDRLKIPVDHVLPHIPSFDDQKRLPLEDE